MDLGLFEIYYIYSQIDEYEQEKKRKEFEESYRNYSEYTSGYSPETVQELTLNSTPKPTFEDLPGIVRIILCLLYLIYKAFAFVITVVGGVLSLLFIIMILQCLLFKRLFNIQLIFFFTLDLGVALGHFTFVIISPFR